MAEGTSDIELITMGVNPADANLSVEELVARDARRRRVDGAGMDNRDNPLFPVALGHIGVGKTVDL